MEKIDGCTACVHSEHTNTSNKDSSRKIPACEAGVLIALGKEAPEYNMLFGAVGLGNPEAVLD